MILGAEFAEEFVHLVSAARVLVEEVKELPGDILFRQSRGAAIFLISFFLSHSRNFFLVDILPAMTKERLFFHTRVPKQLK